MERSNEHPVVWPPSGCGPKKHAVLHGQKSCQGLLLPKRCTPSTANMRIYRHPRWNSHVFGVAKLRQILKQRPLITI